MLSFIIPAKNEEKYIEKCLRSIYDNVSGVDFEVIVVDNGSTDSTPQIVSKNFPQVRLVQEAVPGTNSARHRGVMEARGDVLVFLDADVRLCEGWQRTVLGKLHSDSRIVAVSGPYKFYDFPWYLNLGNEFVLNFLVRPWSFLFFDCLNVAGQMTGGHMVIKRSALEQIGGLDTSMKFFGDDVGTAQKLQHVGRVVFSPKYWVYSSARRYNQHGIVKTALMYFLNYFWFSFTKRPFKKNGYKAVN
jgi:glycosyltransferase involved in cell wall biosynthesis